MPPPSYGGPRLPSNLLDQVGGGPKRASRQGGARGGRGGRGGRNAPVTRKDKRKLERDDKRHSRAPRPTIRRAGNVSQRREPVKNNKDEDDNVDEDDFDEEDVEDDRSTKVVASRIVLKEPAEVETKPTKQAETSKNKVKKPAVKVEAPKKVSKKVQERLAQDDAEIAALERKLGMKGKKLGKSFEDEGLADLLGDLDDDDEDVAGTKRKRSEDREWLERKRRRVAPGIEEEEEEEEEEDEEEEEGGEGEEDEDDNEQGDDLGHATLAGTEDGEDEGSEEGDLMEFDDGDIIDVDMEGEPPDESDDLDEDADEDDNDAGEDEEQEEDDNGAERAVEGEEDGFLDDDEEDFADFGSDEGDEEEADATSIKPKRENPYIAPGTSSDNPAGKYVPPSLRAPASSDAELANRLRRQVQGLLNRLSEANLISILGDVEKLYQNNPRQYVTSTLIDLLLGLLCDPTTLNETFIILHAGFIAAVYRVIGPDFGAQMVERIVESFDSNLTTVNDDAGGKECTNLISLLAQLYNLQVIGAEIVFDYIRSFLDAITELHTELLLRIVKSSGYQLRQDDPSSLKDIVMLVQRTTSQASQEALSVRTKFMIETINDLKNNKLKAGTAASAVNTEHLTRMRKALGTLNNRNVKVSEPMRIGLRDIRDTEKRGKWWLVGASWKGRDSEVTGRSKASIQQEVSADIGDEGTDDLLLLAREARMNTDIRRAIFITIMSATDYKDAHLKLLKLNLTRAQEIETPRVLLHCAGAEKQYNPYYTLIARKLCGEHKLRMAFQFALWDFFKKMGERNEDDDVEEEDEDEEGGRASMMVIVNYAKMFGNLVATGGLGLNILKNLDLVYLQSKTKTLLEILFITIISLARSRSATKKRSPSSALPLKTILETALPFPQTVAGLQYFLKKVVMKTDLTKDEAEKAMVREGCREAVAFLAVAGQDTLLEQ